MKKALKLLGIIALTAIMGFTMAACGDDSDSGDKYDGIVYIINKSDFESIFGSGSMPTAFKILEGAKEALIPKVESGMSKGSYSEIDADRGISYEDILEGLSKAALPSEQQTLFLNKLNANGFAVAVRPNIPDVDVLVLAAIKN